MLTSVDRKASVAAKIREVAASLSDKVGAPGYVAGVYHAGDETVVAHGIANLVTRAPMVADTGFLAGSVTKVMTATLVMREVERGTVELDAPVTRYLRDFRLAGSDVAKDIRVVHLLNHTNGIDADLFLPNVRGPDALQIGVEEMARHCGSLFGPGQFVSYSNGGMIVAGRLLEVVTGRGYHDLLKREIYEPVGMSDSCNTTDEAILHSTAVGHFPVPATGSLRSTRMFMLPESWASAGSTPIVTVADLLGLARTHLHDGVSPMGERVLSVDSTRRMRTPTFDMHAPNIAALGLGWPLLQFGDLTVLWHSGASPGGVACLAAIPEYDLAFAAFGNGPGAIALHDRLMLWLLREYLGVPVPDLVIGQPSTRTLDRYEGTYRSNQMRIDVRAKDGEIEEEMTYEPIDDGQARIFHEFSGGLYPFPPRRLAAIGEGLFAPVGMDPKSLSSIAGRLSVVSFHGEADGRPTHRSAGGRMSRRLAG